MWSTDMDLTVTSGATAKPIRFRPGLSPPQREVEASVARCLRTPPAGAYPVRTLSIGITNRLRGLRYRSIVVVGNYGLVHHGGTIPGKSTSFTPSSILFRPRRCSPQVQPYGEDRSHRDGDLRRK